MSKAPSPASLQNAAAELPLIVGQLRRRLSGTVAPSELTVSQRGVVARLDQHGWTSPAELARMQSMKRQSMASVLLGLEALGLIRRRPHPTDKRQVQFELTTHAATATRKRRTSQQEWLLDELRNLSPEQQSTLLDALEILRRLGDVDVKKNVQTAPAPAGALSAQMHRRVRSEA